MCVFVIQILITVYRILAASPKHHLEVYAACIAQRDQTSHGPVSLLGGECFLSPSPTPGLTPPYLPFHFTRSDYPPFPPFISFSFFSLLFFFLSLFFSFLFLIPKFFLSLSLPSFLPSFLESSFLPLKRPSVRS